MIPFHHIWGDGYRSPFLTQMTEKPPPWFSDVNVWLLLGMCRLLISGSREEGRPIELVPPSFSFSIYYIMIFHGSHQGKHRWEEFKIPWNLILALILTKIMVIFVVLRAFVSATHCVWLNDYIHILTVITYFPAILSLRKDFILLLIQPSKDSYIGRGPCWVGSENV